MRPVRFSHRPALAIFIFPVLQVFIRVAAGQQYTDISQLPAFTDQPLCCQLVFDPLDFDQSSVFGRLGCEDWTCICGDFNQAMFDASSLASVGCSTQTWEAASATSLLNEFCAQFTVTTNLAPSSPTSNPTTTTPPSNVQSGSGNNGAGSGSNNGNSAGICVIDGSNQSGISCSSNNNGKSRAATVKVHHALLILCLLPSLFGAFTLCDSNQALSN
jgi:hypothetical protein